QRKFQDTSLKSWTPIQGESSDCAFGDVGSSTCVPWTVVGGRGALTPPNRLIAALNRGEDGIASRPDTANFAYNVKRRRVGDSERVCASCGSFPIFFCSRGDGNAGDWHSSSARSPHWPFRHSAGSRSCSCLYRPWSGCSMARWKGMRLAAAGSDRRLQLVGGSASAFILRAFGGSVRPFSSTQRRMPG